MKDNMKKFILAVLAVVFTFGITDMLIHSVVLRSVYNQTSGLWRTEMWKVMWLMYISQIIFSIFFVWLFTIIKTAKVKITGFCWGMRVGIMFQIYHVFSQFVIYPIPINLMISWIIFGLLQFGVMGIILGFVYRD